MGLRERVGLEEGKGYEGRWSGIGGREGGVREMMEWGWRKGRGVREWWSGVGCERVKGSDVRGWGWKKGRVMREGGVASY